MLLKTSLLLFILIIKEKLKQEGKNYWMYWITYARLELELINKYVPSQRVWINYFYIIPSNFIMIYARITFSFTYEFSFLFSIWIIYMGARIRGLYANIAYGYLSLNRLNKQ